jgi:hypothetical protein
VDPAASTAAAAAAAPSSSDGPNAASAGTSSSSSAADSKQTVLAELSKAAAKQAKLVDTGMLQGLQEQMIPSCATHAGRL